MAKPAPSEDAAGAGDRRQVQRVVGADAAPEQPPVAVHRVRRAHGGDVAAAVQHGDDGRDQEAEAEQPQPDLGQLAPPAAEDEDHDQRPEQVELLLHRQRPQVAQRGERPGRGVPLADEDLVPVAAVQQPADEVAAGAPERVALEQRHVHGQAGEQQEHGRQQAAGTTQPELAEGDAPGALVLGDQQQRDQVAADHEEDLDAEEPAAQPLVVGVVDHHADHGQGAQAVEPGQVRHAADLTALRSRRGGDHDGATHSGPSIAHEALVTTVI